MLVNIPYMKHLGWYVYFMFGANPMFANDKSRISFDMLKSLCSARFFAPVQNNKP